MRDGTSTASPEIGGRSLVLGNRRCGRQTEVCHSFDDLQFSGSCLAYRATVEEPAVLTLLPAGSMTRTVTKKMTFLRSTKFTLL